MDFAIRIQRVKAAVEPRRAAQHHALARDDDGLSLYVFRDQLRGKVAAANVLFQRGGDVGVNILGKTRRWHNVFTFERGAV